MAHDGKAGGGPTRLEPGTLTALGLGPDAPLMNDPKLFVDARFLASLLVELEAELGPGAAAEAFFQIGATHGVRDARRVVARAAAEAAGEGFPDAPVLPMHVAPLREPGAPGIGFTGEWPEAHEAEARLARLGRGDRPSCALSAGYTSGWLAELHDLDIVAVEETCAARGDAACRFRALERETWRSAADGVAGALPELDRAALGRTAPEPCMPHADGARPGAILDPSDEAVHIWGPVMVLPFTRPDDSLATVGVLGRDPNTAGVRVVVVDQRQQPLDPGWGAELLAQTLDAIETWGAEAMLTGVCALSAPIVAEIAGHHLLTDKDLPEAVASAFQIAEALRHPL